MSDGQDLILPPDFMEKQDMRTARYLLGEAGDIHKAAHVIALVRNRGPKDKNKKANWTMFLNAAIQILEKAEEDCVADAIFLMKQYGVKLPKRDDTYVPSQEALDTNEKRQEEIGGNSEKA